MASLAVAREFMSDFAKLDRVIQKRVHDLTEQVRTKSLNELNKSKGLHLETYKSQKDPRARTIRLGDNHRGIVMVPEGTDKLVLIDVMTHDDADRWMLNNQFKVNAATGALEIVDAGYIAAQAETIRQSAVAETTAETDPLFAHRRDKDFVQLGVDSDLVPVLRLLSTEEQLLGLATALPQGQGEALLALVGVESVETIYAQIAGRSATEPIDTEDLAAALDAPASQAHFHVVTDEEDLAEMLARPLAQWRVYLHHSQREIAYRPTYNGPARVTGGAGTGKTVVAMHRAKALADQIDTSGHSKPILFTTFTRNLAQAIERDLVLLDGSDLLDRVEVLNVDSLAARIVKSVEGVSPRIDDGRTESIWEEKLDELGYADKHSVAFVLSEWEQVVLAQALDSREDYFKASRAGRGVRLDRRGRAEVWKVIEAATREMEMQGLSTFLQVAAEAAGYLESEPVKPYRHVIVDEAQDLHEVQWRLLRRAVGEGPNDMFIVGDAHQRIYGRRSSLSKVGINIVGRSKRLKINYRTTRQILRWALAVLGGGPYDDLDEGTEEQDIAGYHSFLEGSDPTCAGFTTRGEMIDALVEQIGRWIDDGVDESDIGVVARTRRTFSTVEGELRDAGIAAYELRRELQNRDGVTIGNMHRMKGLESRCIAVIDASEDELPSRFVTSESEDPVQHKIDMQSERSLLYVAATRARDDLWVAWAGKPSPFLDSVLSNDT